MSRWRNRILAVICVWSGLVTAQVTVDDLQVVQLYTQDELLALIRQNLHLKRVKDDDCQLVKDIEARADIMKLPSYQFLFGDMLAYGVCVPLNVESGLGSDGSRC